MEVPQVERGPVPPTVTEPAAYTQDLMVRRADIVMLPAVSMTVGPGQVVAIMGPSGSGKTTLLRCLTGLVAPSSGLVVTAGVDMGSASASERARVRRERVGLMFQDPELLPELSVLENVCVTPIFDRVRRTEALRAAQSLLDQVGLGEKAQARTDELSRGQAQRVALARALARQHMTLLIADEPTASLDARAGREVIDLTLETAHARGAAAVIATHDAGVADRCDVVLQLGTGVGR